jgi:hypothetical protein
MTAGPTDNVRCAIRNDNNDLNNNNGFRVCASHASPSLKTLKVSKTFRVYRSRKCSASTDAS